MIHVSVKKQSNYPIDSPKLKGRVKDFLLKNGIVSDAELSIALVGEVKMLELGKKYLAESELHSVFSFTNEELDEKFIYPPDGIIHLGEVIVCYPEAFREAKKEGKLIEEKVWELTEHGILHLLGIHHE